MSRKLLIALLSIALIIELVLTVGSLFAREVALHQFGVASNDHTSFLGYIIGWCLLFVSLVCGLVLWRVVRGGEYATLGYLLGAWWVSIGIGIYAAFQRPDNLLLDTLKGALIILLIYLTQQQEKKQPQPILSVPALGISNRGNRIDFGVHEKDPPIEIGLEPEAFVFTAAPGINLTFIARNCGTDFYWAVRMEHGRASIQLYPVGTFDGVDILRNGELIEDDVTDWYRPSGKYNS